MRKLWLAVIAIVSSGLLLACNQEEGININMNENEIEKLNKKNEVIQGDFIYRLVSEEKKYEHGEKVRIFAELEYIGEQQEIKIYHSASPFYFPMYEKERKYKIDYAMNEPLIETTIKKGEPLREEYKRNGGFSEQDSKNYRTFMKKIMNGNFPEGHYEVNGFADFFVKKENSQENDKYRLETEVEFIVTK